jgi:hypothetical protein
VRGKDAEQENGDHQCQNPLQHVDLRYPWGAPLKHAFPIAESQ